MHFFFMPKKTEIFQIILFIVKKTHFLDLFWEGFFAAKTVIKRKPKKGDPPPKDPRSRFSTTDPKRRPRVSLGSFQGQMSNVHYFVVCFHAIPLSHLTLAVQTHTHGLALPQQEVAQVAFWDAGAVNCVMIKNVSHETVL